MSRGRGGYSVSRTVVAGCFQCGGNQYKWSGPNAQAVAARHARAHGHETWVDIAMHIRYGTREPAATPSLFDSLEEK
jgi:hypothetical protein